LWKLLCAVGQFIPGFGVAIVGREGAAEERGAGSFYSARIAGSEEAARLRVRVNERSALGEQRARFAVKGPAKRDDNGRTSKRLSKLSWSVHG
jgi:hypothetical protein